MAWDFSTEPEFEEQLEWMRAFVWVLQHDHAGACRHCRQARAQAVPHRPQAAVTAFTTRQTPLRYASPVIGRVLA